jgi:peptide/nickel transport system substrate-binding protein
VVGAVAGGNTNAIHPLVGAGLAVSDDQGVLRPQLAETVPTVENGLWKVFPDGRMETTWTIKTGAAWQDGTPLSTDDLLFTLTVMRDRDLPFSGNRAYRLLEEIDAPDSRTVTARWARPYIRANLLFTHSLGSPLPRHLVESAYTQNKEGLLEIPYWTAEYVGAGPYRIVDWEPGSAVLLKANDRYILGRPKIDEIQVKMFSDLNTLMANVLAGTVDLTLGTTLSSDQAINVRDNWKDGTITFVFNSWVRVTPQFVNPTPLVVRDVRFRRALLHSVDRQAMVDTLMYGVGGVADSFVTPSQPEYQAVKDRVVGYTYDQQRAMQQIEELDYRRAPDGFFRHASGQRLEVEVRGSGASEITIKALTAVADYWQRLGVAVDGVPIPPQRVADPEYRARYPAFEIVRYPTDADRLAELYSSQARTPENRYIGSNYANYTNPEFDTMLDRYFSAIPLPQRYQALGDIIHFVSDQLIIMGLFYHETSFVTSKRVEGVTAESLGWNAHAWDVR